MKLVKPKKFLGQHFLKDLKVAQDIADTVDPFPRTAYFGGRTGHGSINPVPGEKRTAGESRGSGL